MPVAKKQGRIMYSAPYTMELSPDLRKDWGRYLCFRFFVALLVAFLLTKVPAASALETPASLLKKARGVLAKLEGEIRVPGLNQSVEVLRDRWGVPHIYASHVDDLFFAQGFVAAQDRLFQLDAWRRVAIGETAEVLGKKGLEGDRFARFLKYRGPMDREWTSYSPDTRRIATAFTRGINAYIDHIGDRLPVEFTLLRSRPKKWQPEDCLGRMSGIIMSRNFQSEIARAELVSAVGVEKARRLKPTDPIRPFGPVSDFDLAGIDRAVLDGYRKATGALPFELPPSESNNWVVDGTLSASGKPLLANDPHRIIALPSLRYLVHLNGPGWNVIGSGEPGLPGVAIGHNERIAWGLTIVGTDQADVYVEETRPGDAAQYRVGSGWQKMKILKERVSVRGEARPQEVELRFTRHGPVIYQDEKRRRAFALKWSGSEPGGAAYLGSLAVGRARNWKEYLAALKGWKIPALNMAYADVDGNIGWVAAGLTPVRKGWDGLLPVPGGAGKYEWQGFLDVKDLPQVFNPPDHFVATANHNILPAGYKHAIAYEWALPYRFARIKERLLAKKKLTRKDFQGMQHDNTSLPGKALIRLTRHLDRKEKALVPYIDLLAKWGGVLSREAQAGPLYALWLRELGREFFGPQVPKPLREYINRRNAGEQTLLAALEKPAPPWFGKKPAEERDLLLQRTFVRAVDNAKKALGEDLRQWSWGRLHTTTFRHPLARLGPAYAQAFNLGPVPRAGDGLTPNAAPYNQRFEQTHGASYRQIFDLADWDRGLATSAPGQSGQPASPHYADLLRLWAKDQYFPLAFSRARVKAVTKHRLILKPARK
jgi:penicillin amidase